MPIVLPSTVSNTFESEMLLKKYFYFEVLTMSNENNVLLKYKCYVITMHIYRLINQL